MNVGIFGALFTMSLSVLNFMCKETLSMSMLIN